MKIPAKKSSAADPRIKAVFRLFGFFGADMNHFQNVVATGISQSRLDAIT
jgi:hypothetical protein